MNDWQQLFASLSTKLDLASSEVLSRAELEAKLSVTLRHLLEHQFEQLAQLMYRLDIPESKFNTALDAPSLSEVAAGLATIVVDRELIRLETRRKWSS